MATQGDAESGSVTSKADSKSSRVVTRSQTNQLAESSNVPTFTAEVEDPNVTSTNDVADEINPEDSCSNISSKICNSKVSKSSSRKSQIAKRRLELEKQKLELKLQLKDLELSLLETEDDCLSDASKAFRRPKSNITQRTKSSKTQNLSDSVVSKSTRNSRVTQRTERSKTTNRSIQSTSSSKKSKSRLDCDCSDSHDCHWLQECVKSLKLPQPEVPVFDGDPFEYCEFIEAFEFIIEEKERSPKKRLYFLSQFTSGSVRKLVRSCMQLPPREGYREARALIKEKYGHPLKVALAHINHLTAGPQIQHNDKEALDEFSTDLISCKNTLRSIGYLHKMDHPDTLRKIVQHLPPSLQNAWLREASKITYEQNKDITINHISDFVRVNARTLNHPVFGDMCASRNKAKPRYQQNYNKNARSFATKTQSSPNQQKNPVAQSEQSQQLSCLICTEKHYLNQCQAFRDMSSSDRVTFVKNNKLCFACLSPGHSSAECVRTNPCLKPGCDERHTTLLHDGMQKVVPSVQQPKLAPCTSSSSTTKGCVSAAVHTTNKSQVYLPILPVRVKLKNSNTDVVSYAFLDRGSTASFCTTELTNALKVNGRKMDLHKSTINKQETETCELVTDLEVCDMDYNFKFNLPQLYSTPSIPISENDVIDQEEIDRISNFNGVSIPLIDNQKPIVGLLIGCNYSTLMAASEVRLSNDNKLYATKTHLGWVVSGPSSTPNIKFAKSHFVKTSEKPQLCNLCFDNVKLEKQNKSEYSVNDVSFLEKVESTIKQLGNNHYQIALPLKNKCQELLNNISQAQQRLNQLKSKLLEGPGLTNQLLLMKRTKNLPPGIFVQTDLYARKRWKQIQYLADVFWSRWTSEYLLLLQQREKWNSSQRNFNIDDIVLVVDHNMPRNSWSIGRIISTYPDKNEFVRNVQIKTKTSVIDRPISKICLLSAVEESNFNSNQSPPVSC